MKFKKIPRYIDYYQNVLIKKFYLPCSPNLFPLPKDFALSLREQKESRLKPSRNIKMRIKIKYAVRRK